MRFLVVLLLMLFCVDADARKATRVEKEDLGKVEEVFPSSVTAQELCQAIKETVKFKFVKGFRKQDKANLPKVCQAIVEGAKRFSLSPFVIAGVVWSESTFRINPPSGKVCHKSLQYWKGVGPNPPGWPKPIIKCRRIGAYEIGYMQLIWWHQDPKDGYRTVTGLEPKGSKYRRDLRDTRINILVGSYELALECRKCRSRGHRHHHGRMPVKVRRFFNRNTQMWKHFCVAHFNWGSGFGPQIRWFNQWPYPVKVLSKALVLAKAVRKIRTR